MRIRFGCRLGAAFGLRFGFAVGGCFRCLIWLRLLGHRGRCPAIGRGPQPRDHALTAARRCQAASWRDGRPAPLARAPPADCGGRADPRVVLPAWAAGRDPGLGAVPRLRRARAELPRRRPSRLGIGADEAGTPPAGERHRGARRRGMARAGPRRGRRAGRLAARGRRERGGRRAAAAAPAPRLGARPARRRGGPRGARVRPARAGPARRLGRARRRGPGEDRGAPLGGGGPDRGPRGDRPLRRARRGGRDRPARRRRRRGGRPQRVSDPGDLLPALPPGVQGRRGRLQPDRPRDRRPRPRGVAPARRDRRGNHQLLRLPERRLARPPARALGGNGGPDDAPAARRQRDVRRARRRSTSCPASAATAAASTSTPAAAAFPRRRRAARRASSARRRRRRRPRGRTGFPRSGRARQAQPGGPPPAGRDDRRAWPRARRRR